MPVSRTIYTQGNVLISGSGINSLFLSGVQSANFSVSEPKQDVNEMGVLGSINKVQLEPIGATAEIQVVFSPNFSGAGFAYMNSGIIPYLVASAKLPNPQYYDITISGIGQVKSGLLSYFTIEAAVGAVPTMTMRFEGQSGTPQVAGAAPTTLNTGTFAVLIPSQVTGIYFSGGVSTCAQNIKLQWEMPIERMNCLGNAIDAPTIFTRPPGTTTVTIEGTTMPGLVTGFDISNLGFYFTNIREVSRSINLGIGDAYESFNSTQETNGLSMSVIEPIFTGLPWTADQTNNPTNESGVGLGNNFWTPTGTNFGPDWVVDTGIRVKAGEFYRVFLGLPDDDGGGTGIISFGVLNDSNTFVEMTSQFTYVGASDTASWGKVKILQDGKPGFRVLVTGSFGTAWQLQNFDKYLQG